MFYLHTADNNKEAIVHAGGVKPLLTLARSDDIRVKRNATGALLNLTHLRKPLISITHDVVSKM